MAAYRFRSPRTPLSLTPCSPVSAKSRALRGVLTKLHRLSRRRASAEMSVQRPGGLRTSSACQARADIQAGSQGWLVVIELPGIAPDAVALAIRKKVLLVHASGVRCYEASLPLPANADPHSLRWQCRHGLLEGWLSPHQREEQADAP